MIGKIICIFFIFFAYSLLSAGLCISVIGRNNPLHKFPIETDSYDGSKTILIKTDDDKFFFFILFFIWPLLVLFYWIPIGIYHIFKFLIEFIGWSIAKLFKL